MKSGSIDATFVVKKHSIAQMAICRSSSCMSCGNGINFKSRNLSCIAQFRDTRSKKVIVFPVNAYITLCIVCAYKFHDCKVIHGIIVPRIFGATYMYSLHHTCASVSPEPWTAHSSRKVLWPSSDECRNKANGFLHSTVDWARCVGQEICVASTLS